LQPEGSARHMAHMRQCNVMLARMVVASHSALPHGMAECSLGKLF